MDLPSFSSRDNAQKRRTRNFFCGHKKSNIFFIFFRNSDGRLVFLVRVVRLLLLFGLRLRYEIVQCQTEVAFGELLCTFSLRLPPPRAPLQRPRPKAWREVLRWSAIPEEQVRHDLQRWIFQTNASKVYNDVLFYTFRVLTIFLAQGSRARNRYCRLLQRRLNIKTFLLQFFRIRNSWGDSVDGVKASI